MSLSHLRALEAESIHIIREVAAEFQKLRKHSIQARYLFH